MENITYSYINGMQENETVLPIPQFPFWLPTLAIWTINILFSSSQLHIAATDVTLLVTMLKTKRLCNPLNSIHILVYQCWCHRSHLDWYSSLVTLHTCPQLGGIAVAPFSWMFWYFHCTCFCQPMNPLLLLFFHACSYCKYKEEKA